MRSRSEERRQRRAGGVASPPRSVRLHSSRSRRERWRRRSPSSPSGSSPSSSSPKTKGSERSRQSRSAGSRERRERRERRLSLGDGGTPRRSGEGGNEVAAGVSGSSVASAASASAAVPAVSWSLPELRVMMRQELEAHAKERDLVASADPELPFDPTAEVDAAYVQELRDCGSKIDGGHMASPSQQQSATPRDGTATAATDVAMAALELVDSKDGKWRTPSHIAKMSHETADYDWWFRQMREWLDDCRIRSQTQWIDYYRGHCERDFWADVRDKLIEDKVEPSKVLTHPHKFQEYVCFRFTPQTYPNELMGRLLALQDKQLDPTPAWLETSRLVYCYNEFMRRRKGTPITDLQHAYHFAYALRDSVFEYLLDLLDQRHPKVSTARRAYAAALRHVCGRQGRHKRRGTAEEEGGDQVMTATTGQGEKKARGRRGKWGVKKEKKEVAMVAEKQEATMTTVATPPPLPPPPASPASSSASLCRRRRNNRRPRMRRRSHGLVLILLWQAVTRRGGHRHLARGATIVAATTIGRRSACGEDNSKAGGHRMRRGHQRRGDTRHVRTASGPITPENDVGHNFRICVSQGERHLPWGTAERPAATASKSGDGAVGAADGNGRDGSSDAVACAFPSNEMGSRRRRRRHARSGVRVGRAGPSVVSCCVVSVLSGPGDAGKAWRIAAASAMVLLLGTLCWRRTPSLRACRHYHCAAACWKSKRNMLVSRSE